MKINNRLTALQAFNIMREFLEAYFNQTASDSIGSLLSCMQFLEDGYTVDQAIWEDWEALVKDNDPMTPMQAFNVMHLFLKHFFRRSSSTNVRLLLNDMQRSDDGTIINPETALLWDQCVAKVFAQPADAKCYLHIFKP